jgi:hypothetical protein
MRGILERRIGKREGDLERGLIFHWKFMQEVKLEEEENWGNKEFCKLSLGG